MWPISTNRSHFKFESRVPTFGLSFPKKLSISRPIKKLAFIHMQTKTNFHMKRWAPGLALQKRPKVIRKWPIQRKLRINDNRQFRGEDGLLWKMEWRWMHSWVNDGRFATGKVQWLEYPTGVSGVLGSVPETRTSFNRCQATIFTVTFCHQFLESRWSHSFPHTPYSKMAANKSFFCLQVD